MKKIILILTIIFLGVSTSFATDPPIVNVSWDADNCSCPSAFIKFKVSVSIYDNANGVYAVQNVVRYSSDGTDEYLIVEVEEMLDYCHESHDYTPAFTVTATVWGILVGDIECCTGSGNDTGDCHDFEADDVFTLPQITLN